MERGSPPLLPALAMLRSTKACLICRCLFKEKGWHNISSPALQLHSAPGSQHYTTHPGPGQQTPKRMRGYRPVRGALLSLRVTKEKYNCSLLTGNGSVMGSVLLPLPAREVKQRAVCAARRVHKSSDLV